MRLDLTEVPYIGSSSYGPETTRRIGEAVDAALSARSTGSAGVAAEPVAWAYDWQSAPQHWQLVVSPVAPDRSRDDVRNIRPLYEHPPIAAELTAWKVDVQALCDSVSGDYYLGKQGEEDLVAKTRSTSDPVSFPIVGADKPKIVASDGDEIDAGYIGGAAMQVIGAIAEAAGFWGRPEIEASLKYFGGEGWTKGQEILPFVMAEHAEPSSASPAGDLNSLSAGASALAVARTAFYGVNGRDPGTKELAAALRSVGIADPFAPAAPRKGQSASNLIKAIYKNVSAVTAADGKTWVDYAQVQEVITALLIPADRGETQAVGDGWRLVPVEPTDEMRWQGGTAQHDKQENNAGIYAAMLAAAPTPDQNRGEPDQGGSNVGARP